MEFREKVAPKHSAVIVVDLQNDFCHPNGAWARVAMDPHLSQRLGSLSRFLSEARTKGIPVLFLRTIYNNWTISPVIEEWWRRLGIGGLCIQDKWGAQFYELQPLNGDRVVDKYRPSGFMETDLDLTLRAKEIQTLLLVGVGAWGGLFETARDALAKNYYAVLVEDCAAGGLPEEQSQLVELFRRYYGEVGPSQKVIDAWRG